MCPTNCKYFRIDFVNGGYKCVRPFGTPCCERICEECDAPIKECECTTKVEKDYGREYDQPM